MSKKPLKEFVVSIPHSLGIPRSKMPQIKQDKIDDFLKYLKQEKVTISNVQLPADEIKPTQRELDSVKVEKIIKDILNHNIKDQKYIISSDNYILDGHHRWAAYIEVSPKTKLNCQRVSIPMTKLLELAHQFEGVGYKEIHETAILNFIATLAEEPDPNKPETNQDRVKEKQKREKEELERQQEDELDRAREDDFNAKQKEIEQKRVEKERERQDKEAEQKAKTKSESWDLISLIECLEDGTDEAREHYLDGTPGQEDAVGDWNDDEEEEDE